MAAPRRRVPSPLPPVFDAWLAGRGWRLRAHQARMLEVAAEGRGALLIAPTGGGKTLAGFLPSLVELSRNGGGKGLHTLYISPLKALTTDIARNLEAPLAEMALPITHATRTGDTPQNRRARMRLHPPDHCSRRPSRWRFCSPTRTPAPSSLAFASSFSTSCTPSPRASAARF